MVLEDVKVDLSSLKVTILESKHEYIDRFASTFFLPILRNKMTHLIEGRVFDLLNSEVFDRINDAIKQIEKQGVRSIIS